MSTVSVPLTSDEQIILKKAAYGAVNLLAIAYPGPIATTKANMAGAMVLANATGAVGQVLAGKEKIHYTGRTTAEIADEVLPALTRTVAILRAKAPAEVDEFRRAVTTAVNQAAASVSEMPARSDMVAKITAALDADA